jgi:hypothetical protein
MFVCVSRTAKLHLSFAVFLNDVPLIDLSSLGLLAPSTSHPRTCCRLLGLSLCREKEKGKKKEERKKEKEKT